MIETDKQEFFTLIADVCAFYGKDFSAFTGSVWWEAMKPYDLAAVRSALGRHCANPDAGQFAPKPADVVRMLQGGTQDSALAAWSKVDRAVRQVGTYQTVAFDDPLIHRTLHDMGGWIELGRKTEDEWPFVRNEFVNRYRGYRMRSDRPDYPPTLIGIAEAQNVQDGRQSQPPILVGDPAGARRTITGGTTVPLLSFEPMKAGDVAALAAPSQEAA